MSELDVHLLMNHSLPGVNAGYITHDALLGGHLRKQQERISQAIEDSLSRKADVQVRLWLRSMKVDLEVVVPDPLKRAA